jgi:hypothetical protein
VARSYRSQYSGAGRTRGAAAAVTTAPVQPTQPVQPVQPTKTFRPAQITPSAAASRNGEALKEVEVMAAALAAVAVAFGMF